MIENRAHDAGTVSEQDASPAKKPYKSPVLVKLGSLRDMTMSNWGGGRKDGQRRGPRYTGRGGVFGGLEPLDR